MSDNSLLFLPLIWHIYKNAERLLRNVRDDKENHDQKRDPETYPTYLKITFILMQWIFFYRGSFLIDTDLESVKQPHKKTCTTASKHTHTHLGGHCALVLTAALASRLFRRLSGARSPEDDGAIGRRGEEGLVVWVPPALDHLVPVLPRQCLREGLR